MAQDHAQLAPHDVTEGQTTGRKGLASRAMTSEIQDAELNQAETHRSRNLAQLEVLLLHLERNSG